MDTRKEWRPTPPWHFWNPKSGFVGGVIIGVIFWSVLGLLVLWGAF